jgi:predicted TIM-barrel fold metal-dependent hydrolase
MAYPQLAAQELERCVSQLKFVGGLVDDHLLNNTFYDSSEYDALWSALERLDVPIYLHPTYPPISEVNAPGGLHTPYQNSFTINTASVLATAGWGECNFSDSG